LTFTPFTIPLSVGVLCAYCGLRRAEGQWGALPCCYACKEALESKEGAA
jgi:hypothetical protein